MPLDPSVMTTLQAKIERKEIGAVSKNINRQTQRRIKDRQLQRNTHERGRICATLPFLNENARTKIEESNKPRLIQVNTETDTDEKDKQLQRNTRDKRKDLCHSTFP